MLITDNPFVWDSAKNQIITETDVYRGGGTEEIVWFGDVFKNGVWEDAIKEK